MERQQGSNPSCEWQVMFEQQLLEVEASLHAHSLELWAPSWAHIGTGRPSSDLCVSPESCAFSRPVTGHAGISVMGCPGQSLGKTPSDSFLDATWAVITESQRWKAVAM